ncbi:MAG: hypothetical protein GYB36_05600 [Alphaproteobacteria bacterium]|nr:hypothetical protein [Alphaproteobacteria bacterium]
MQIAMMIRAVLLALVFLVPAGAAKACDGYDLAVTQMTAFSYNAADPVTTTLEVEFRAVESGLPRRCRNQRVQIDIIGGTARDPDLEAGGERLQARWINTGEVNRNGDQWRLRRSARTDLVEGDTLSIAFFEIDAGQFVTPGEYRQTWRITIGDNEMTVPIIVTVEPAIRLEGDSQSGTQALDLGDITNGARASSDFFFRTNSAVAITLVSDNHGTLQHEQGKQFGRIPYSAAISGQAVDLSSGSDTVDIPFSGAAIQSGRLEVEVAPSPHEYAGRYRDVITMSFIPY